ncbi:MAG: hypothetical protein V4673_04510 [Pseudomonadota bacterium]
MRFVLLVALGMRVSAVAAEIHRFAVAFAPFEKGGHGGFALDPALLEQHQEQIPRHRYAMPAPFYKGGYKNKRGTALAVDLQYELSIVGLEFRLFAFAFAPFEKGGYGRFSLDFALLEQHQKQIPRHRCAMPAPFYKGGYKNKRTPALAVDLQYELSIVGLEFRLFAFAFVPFEKGGYGGFALDPALLEQNQEQIPRHRCAMPAPFYKGGYKNKRGPALAVDLQYELSIVGLEFRLFAFAFAPFEKGGYGGFALDFALLEQHQKQIPRHRYAMPAPFCKGGYERKAGLASSVRPPCRAARPAGCAG